jgi:integrase/recombinase XerD
MAIKRAKTLGPDELKKVFKVIESRERGEYTRDKVAVLLSVKAGLRASEIAGLRWADVTDASGNVTDLIHVGSHIQKGSEESGRDRQVPMNHELKRMLIKLRKERPGVDDIIRYGDYKPTISPNALTVWFHRLYSEAGLDGCSSHSGRRTFITTTARIANLHGGSLRDVQIMAGHASIATTERYIDPSDAMKKMVDAV